MLQRYTVKNSSITTKHLYPILTFRSHHQIFIRRSWYSVLPSLDATISCRIKKAVVGLTQLITALVSIHSSMTLLADMYSFLDPPVRTMQITGDKFFTCQMLLNQQCQSNDGKSSQNTDGPQYLMSHRLFTRATLASTGISCHVHPSQVGVLLKRLNAGSRKQYLMIAQGI